MQASGLETRILLDEESVRVSLLRFAAGHELPEHSSPRAIAIQVLEGEGEFSTRHQRHRLERGIFLNLPPSEPHSVRAETALTFLLTVHKLGAPNAPTRANPPKNALETLLDSHRRSEQFCRVVMLLAQQPPGAVLEMHEKSALELASRFFADTRAIHHRDEEESLFPRLMGTYLAPKLRKLSAEHVELDHLHSILQRQLEHWIRKSRLEHEERRELETTLAQISETKRRHRAIEEEEIYPFAKQSLDSATWETILQEFVERRK
jgi:quercetin dioxygenase-like cupin family protein/hemerythrin-like domain-containing protein